MDHVDAPLWAQNALAILAALAAGATALWQSKKNARRERDTPEGPARVIAASFTEHETQRDLIKAITNLDGTMREVGEQVEKLHDMLHDEILVARAAARAKG